MSRLSQYFTGVATKRLRSVEADLDVSHQHEINGIKPMVDLFGTDRREIEATYIYMGDDETDIVQEEGGLTWYDSRENQPHRSAEYRLYFQGNGITELAEVGDTLIVAKRPDDTVIFLVIKQGSTYESQLLWLFGIEEANTRFVVSSIEGDANRSIGFAERTILEALQIEVEQAQDNWLDLILETFGDTFPSTRVFSAFARGTIPNVSSLDDPDSALMQWIDQEEMLFRTLEKHIVQKRIDKGFSDVDVFVSFSLTVHNRRKSRMGYALENHLEQVFKDYNISYSREKVTENKSKPDFTFPSIDAYHDPNFPENKLSILGAKSTCKDRWRQVLAEADRVKEKHLLTLEPSISENQTDEMQAKQLQLVLPEQLHQTYLPKQQNWLMNLNGFVDLAQSRQK